MRKKVRKSSNKGVKVTIIEGEGTFTVLLDISKDANLNEKRHNEYFIIQFKAGNKKYILEQEAHFMWKDQPYKKKNICKKFKKQFVLRNGVQGSISIEPEMYLSKKLFSEYKKKQKEKAEKDWKKVVNIHTQDPNKPNPVQPYFKTVYTKNNLARPYKGGKCSPR